MNGELRIRVKPNSTMMIRATPMLARHLGELIQPLVDLGPDYYGVAVEVDTTEIYPRPLEPGETRLEAPEAPYDILALYLSGVGAHLVNRA